MRNFLKGKKTYATALLAAVVTGLHYAGVIDDATYQLLMGLLGTGAVATVRAAIAKMTPTDGTHR